jgi:hypothetical protein
MGEYQTVDISHKSWLATLGCCAPHKHNHEDEVELRGRNRGILDDGPRYATYSPHTDDEVQLTFDQPQPIAPLRFESDAVCVPQRPTTAYSTFSSWMESGKEAAVRTRARASSRASTFRSHWTGNSKRTTTRPSIGAPTDFRHLNDANVQVEPIPRRRASFRPLELSIYLPDNRLSPLPDFTSCDWDQKLPDLEFPTKALLRSRPNSLSSGDCDSSTHQIHRKPVRSSLDTISLASSPGHSRSTSRLSNFSMAPTIDIISRPASTLAHFTEALNSHPPTPPAQQTTHARPPQPPSLLRSNTSLTAPSPANSRGATPSPVPLRTRAMTEPSPPPQKRSSIRKMTRDNVDEAIRELNTIVEEARRADAYRSSQNSLLTSSIPPSPSMHVPAIAPGLRMHVRSETLSDIGSVFSMPANKGLPATPNGRESVEKRSFVHSKKLSGTAPWQEEEGDAEEAESVGFATSRPSTSGSTRTRLSLWLRRQNRRQNASKSSISSPPVPPTTSSSQEPFYQCQTPQTRHTQHPSISSVSTYASTRSAWSTQGERESISLVSPVSPITTTSRGSRSMSSRSWKASRGVVGMSGACAKEAMALPPAYQELDPHPTTSPRTPVGVAF